MHPDIKTHMQAVSLSVPKNLILSAACALACGSISAQVAKAPVHRSARKAAPAPVVEQAPPPPPMPHWPVNDSPTPASVVWDASGLRINATNSSLQQILNEVSTNTGTKVIGNFPDQRVFGSYGPGQASDVLLQLLQGSGFNVLLAGDLGHGAPSQIVLTPRRGGGSNAPAAGMTPQQPDAQPDQDENESVDQPEQPEQQEETTVPAIPPPTAPGQNQPGGPNGPMRTPQEIMQEMQQRQLLQQQQLQQQQQQQANPTAPQQENPE